MSTLNLKRIFWLCKTLWYQFPRGLHFNIATNKIYFYKNQITSKKLGHLDEKTAKNGYLYVPFSQKLLNAAHDQKTSLAQKKLVHTAILLTFAFRSKQRPNEQYFR